MTRQEYNDLISDLYTTSMALSEKKSKDYATEDVLSNFKNVAKLCEILKIDCKTSWGYAMLMAVMKIARISNLTNKQAQCESIEDSIQDCINYLFLMYACMKEREK